MNLDEMKNSWNVLNERLEQNEILNKRIIEEMVASKTKSAYGKGQKGRWRNCTDSGTRTAADCWHI